MIGVLILVAVLTSIVSASVIRTLVERQRAAEDASLDNVSAALKSYVRRTRIVPDAAGWSSAVASELSRSIPEVASTREGRARVLLIDPGLVLSPLGGTNPAGVPYAQSGAGASQPANLRMVLLSSTGPDLPVLTNVAFADVWNAAPEQLPTGWPGTWAGRGPDLHLRRVDLGSLFRRLVLSNLTLTNQALWSLEGTNVLAIAPRGVLETWIVDTSAVTFYSTPSNIVFREIIRDDTSYVRETAGWRHRIFAGLPAIESCGPFAELVEAFMDAPANPGSPKSNQQTVIDAMFHYMEAYSFWSYESGCDNGNHWFTAQNQVSAFSANFDSAAKFLSQ